MSQSDTVEYRINPHGMYALYRTAYGWRESASVRNESLDLRVPALKSDTVWDDPMFRKWLIS